MIKHLEMVKEEHGDLECNVMEPDSFKDGFVEDATAYVSLSCDEFDNVKAVTFVDKETAEAFTE